MKSGGRGMSVAQKATYSYYDSPNFYDWLVYSLQPYVGAGYRYRGAKEDGAARYEFTIEKAGDYEVRVSYSPHENRATNTRVVIESADGAKETTINQRNKPPLPQNFLSLGVFKFAPGKPAVVTIGGKPADGNVHADAVQLLPK